LTDKFNAIQSLGMSYFTQSKFIRIIIAFTYFFGVLKTSIEFNMQIGLPNV
jgi:hypothetical protein